MGKRSREDDGGYGEQESSAKRPRSEAQDRLSRLSDELILRVLSFLPVPDLVLCQRISRKYNTLAGDGQIWKSHYYNRFVRPRASRLPGLKDSEDSRESLHFASKASRWLDDEHLVRKGGTTNWKRQYKLRHNWSRGSCAVNEIPVAQEAPIPPVLVQMQDGIIYIADQMDGLRAWSANGERRLIAQMAFEQSHYLPTALAIQAESQHPQKSRLVVGFESGSFAMYGLDASAQRFTHLYSHVPSSHGVIAAVALAFPYVVTMTATHWLSLYRFNPRQDSRLAASTMAPPALLHSLKSHSVWPPLSTSLRTSEPNIVISIAYALPTYLSGWTVGIQEIHIDTDGKVLGSRLASAIEQHYRPLAFSLPPMAHHLPPPSLGSLATATATEMRHIHSKPTSLSYTHPYLLVSHPDNTLTLYLVTSTADSLTISNGSRLWGHTSSVSGAHVAARGKAVSVSRRGDELRVWELEGGFASSAAKRRLASRDLSVQIRPDKQRAEGTSPQAGLDLRKSLIDDAGKDDDASDLTLTRGWIGFDEENVVVLKEQSGRYSALSLVVYDFT